MKPLRLTLCLCLALVSVSAPAWAEPKTTFERWYILQLGEDNAGWSNSLVQQDGDTITTHSKSHIAIRRGPITLTVEVATRFAETAAGKPLEAQVTQKMAEMAIVQTLRFTSDGIEATSQQGGQEQKQVYPLPAQPWLPPQAAQRYIEAQMAGGAKEIRLWTLDPSAGPRPFEVTAQVQERGHVEVMGKTVPAVRWTLQASYTPGVVMMAHVDERGRPIRSTVDLGGLRLTMLEADKDLALAQKNPPEMLLSTLIKPDRPIERPRQVGAAVYELRFAGGPPDPPEPEAPEAPAGGGAPPLLPEAASQRVAWVDRRTARVTVDVHRPLAASGDRAGEAHLRSTTMLNHADPKLRELLVQALAQHPGELSPARQAEVLRQFVHRFIDAKDLSVGFASASEVARTAQGDCTEHAVLLAALLRAAGIPSRTVSGIVYADQFLDRAGIFGYHMWTQAWLNDDGGKWIDLDPTLDEQTPFDATHIALAHSAMADDEMVNDMMRLMPMIGRLSIQVIETSQRR